MAKLVVRDPFAQFGALVDDAWGRGRSEPATWFSRSRGQHSMAVDIYDTDAGVAIDASLPGFDSDDVEVTFDDGRLMIRASHDVDSCEDERHDHVSRRYRLREVYRRRYERTFGFGDEFEADSIEAEMRSGVLHVSLQRTPNEEPRRIPISVE